MKLTNIESRKKNTFNNRWRVGWKLEFIFLDHLIVMKTHFLWDGIKCKKKIELGTKTMIQLLRIPNTKF
jgi:hypothetical protein